MILSKPHKRILRALKVMGRSAATDEIGMACGDPFSREHLLDLEKVGLLRRVASESRHEYWGLTEEGSKEAQL